MMKRCHWTRIALIVVGGVISMSLGGALGSSAYEAEDDRAPAPPPRASSSRMQMKPEEGAGKEEKILKKLDEVLTNQATIRQQLDTVMQRFDAIMEELRIIKVRATIRGS